MKVLLFVMHCIVLTLPIQAWATTDSQSCESRAQQLRGAERENFLKSCLSQTLAQASSPERTRAATAQEKRGSCEQNAKNMKLADARKSQYINDCMNTNVAASEARKAGVKEQVVAKSEHTQHAMATPSPKSHAEEPKPAGKRPAKQHAENKKPKVSKNEPSKGSDKKS